MSRSKRSRIEKALQEHLAGARDAESRSPLDLLILEVMADLRSKSQWSAALCQLINDTQDQHGLWWYSIEIFVAMTKICSSELADTLEQVVIRDNAPDAIARASVYSMLAECARPVSASTLWNDSELRRAAPLLWLDLLLPLIPELEKRQQVVLDAVSRREFDVSAFEMRLDAMRGMAGANLGDWLRRLRQVLPNDQHAQYDEILNAAGFTIPSLSQDLIKSRPVHSSPSTPKPLGRAFAERIPSNGQTYLRYRKIEHYAQAQV